MYSDRSNRSTYGTVSHSNASTLRPPWALSEEPSSRRTRGRNGTYINNNNRNPAAGRFPRNNGNGNNNNATSYNSGNSNATNRNNTSRGNIRSETTTRRYGRRGNFGSDERDFPFLLNFYPVTPHESARDVHTIRERERRADAAREDRLIANDENRRHEVTEEVPITKDVLTVMECDLHMYENTKQHQTNQYECTGRDKDPQLVVRRGQHFTLTFTFQRPFRSEYDDLQLKLSVGKTPSEESGSLFYIPLVEDMSTTTRRFHTEDGWAAKVVGQSGNSLSVVVFIPADAIVGEWKFSVATSLAESGVVFEYEGVGEIYVLFNPWCPDDQVFYGEDPSDLNEYVLNEYGCVFEGNSDYISRRPWFYGQFENGILDVCMTILRLSFGTKVTKEGSDIITVLRNLSHILNASTQTSGVMVGNWSGNYSDGTHPSSWRGSVKILRQFARTERPVKYVQCFVFSHVFTTVCRALGIPCRSLTNYESAHDTDKTATIDSYEDEDGNDLRELKSDSIWNYHCWNDVWINRPDLDLTSSARGSYSGWHAIDATPQEQSGGKFQCGPSPLAAIKNGEIGVGFDTRFIYGEVNGEVCTWMVPRDTDRGLKLMERKPNAVGKGISTKLPDGKPARGNYNPGSREVHVKRLDITDLYKYPEGSREERESLKMAVGDGFGARIFQEAGGLTLDITKVPSTLIGSDFEMKAYVTNKSTEVKEFDITLVVLPIDYRGERIGWDNIALHKTNGVTLWPNSREVFVLPVSEKKYLHYCDSSVSMMLRAFAKVKGEEKPLSKLEKVTLRCPEVTITVPMAMKVKRGQPFMATVLITNPTSRPMTSCSLHIGGTIHPASTQGFTESDGTYFKKIKDIFPNEVRTVTIEVKAQRHPLSNNIRELDLDVESTELPNMSGSLDITVL